MLTDPTKTTVGDLCTAALREANVVGFGQAPSGEDINTAQARLQFMLQQWQRKRWLVYHLVTLGVVSTGALSYTVGPGGQIDTGVGSARPAKIESAFLRQLQNSQPNQIDYPLELLQSKEDYSAISLKTLSSFPGWIYYDPDWPLGRIFPWPVPQANIYEVFINVMVSLPGSFANLGVEFTIPWEYYGAMLYNLALRLRSRYGLMTPENSLLVGLAKDSLNVLRTANAQIARLAIPADLNRQGLYNIFSDRSY